MDRNLLLAFALSFLVLTTWTFWQEQALEGAPRGSPAVERAAEPEPMRTAEPERRRYADLPPAEPRAAAPPERVRAAREPGEIIEVERELFRAELDTRGAVLRSWELNRYTDESGANVVLASPDLGSFAATPFLELGLGDLSDAIWEVTESNENTVAFRLERQGVTIRKRFDFQHESGYAFRLSLDVENHSDDAAAPRFLVDWIARVRPGNDFREQALSVLHDGGVESEQLAGIGLSGWFSSEAKEQYDYPNEIDWAGTQTTYFLSALFPDDPTQASARFVVLAPGEEAAAAIFFDPVELPTGGSATREYRGYVGPKEVARLEALGGGAVQSIDLGWSWVRPLTRFFGWLLGVLYALVGNYGVSIIVLTVLVRVVTAPLTVKQMRSMERMRKLQPRMKEIQERHADDRQAQSQAMMDLYKREKVNPLGGCFPMLLQLPVFIGLFYALRSSIQLRQAPFLWIDDLSAPDLLFELPGIGLPIRALPIVMGGTMFLQQRITPMQMDPAQARMMMTVMPVMMTVLFYQFASGLVLYWMMSNLLAIGHQLWIGRKMQPASPQGGPRGEAKAA